MRCRNCGEEISDKALVCWKCGTPVKEADRPKDDQDSGNREPDIHQQKYSFGEKERKAEMQGKEHLAKTGLILGLAGIPLTLFPFLSVITSIAAIILGVLGLDSGKKKQAAAAITLGIVILLFSMTLLIALAIVTPYMDELSQLFSEMMQ